MCYMQEHCLASVTCCLCANTLDGESQFPDSVSCDYYIIARLLLISRLRPLICLALFDSNHFISTKWHKFCVT